MCVVIASSLWVWQAGRQSSSNSLNPPAMYDTAGMSGSGSLVEGFADRAVLFPVQQRLDRAGRHCVVASAWQGANKDHCFRLQAVRHVGDSPRGPMACSLLWLLEVPMLVGTDVCKMSHTAYNVLCHTGMESLSRSLAPL